MSLSSVFALRNKDGKPYDSVARVFTFVIKEIKVGKKWKFNKERPAIDMGENFDKTHTKLLPYVEVEPGVQVHPDRVKDYKKRRKKIIPR